MRVRVDRRAVLISAVLAGGSFLRPVDAKAAPVSGASKVAGTGGGDLLRAGGRDRLTLEFAASGGGVVDLSGFDAFGVRYQIHGPSLLIGSDGARLAYRTTGSVRYDQQRGVLSLSADGKNGGLIVSGGNLAPPKGEPFGEIILRQPDGVTHSTYVSTRGFSRPDHAAEREHAPATVAALGKLSAYLDTKRTPSGGWLIASAFGPPAEDPHATAHIATGYLRLHKLTGDDGYQRRAREALDWLVKNQHPTGAYGFPWRWGLDNGHKYVPEHFANGNDHPAGTPYGVTILTAATGLLDGYQYFSDRRYLSAAERAADYLLRSPSGFQWLDTAKTKGSIPYCTLTPVLKADDPLVTAHNVVPRLKNTSIDIYNVDAAGLRFLHRLRTANGNSSLRRYERALLRNLVESRLPNGGSPYAWYKLDQLDYYAYAVAVALTTYGTANHDDETVDTGRRMLTARENAFHPSLFLYEDETTIPLSMDNTATVLAYLKRTLASQKPDGSFSGTDNRSDADKLTGLSRLLLQAGVTDSQ